MRSEFGVRFEGSSLVEPPKLCTKNYRFTWKRLESAGNDGGGLSLRHFKWATSLIAGRSYRAYVNLKRGNKRSALPRSIICSNARGSFRPGNWSTVDSMGSGA